MRGVREGRRGEEDKNLVLCSGKDKMKNLFGDFFLNSVILYFRVFYQPS